MKIIVGISGATGAIYGIKILEALQRQNIESHLIISEWAKITIKEETNYSVDSVAALSDYYYDNKDMTSRISSGSFKAYGMVIAPCSMKTLSGIANGFSDDLIIRTADVCLKERRKLVVLARETPLNLVHLENMLMVTKSGGVVMPPVPAFYSKPETIEDLVGQTVERVLDQLGVDTPNLFRWEGKTP